MSNFTRQRGAAKTVKASSRTTNFGASGHSQQRSKFQRPSQKKNEQTKKQTIIPTVALNTSRGPLIEFPVHANWQSLNPINRLVGFYHFQITTSHDSTIAEEQFNLLKITGLLDKLNVIYYTTIGDTSSKSMSNTLQTLLHNTKDKITGYPKFIEIRNTMESTNETLTLSYIYDFCQNYSGSKVLYFHNRERDHHSGEDIFLRHFSDCYVLNTQCMEAIKDGFDTCGWRMSPFPYPHYPGNYWWARCKYIKSLLHPASMILNSSLVDASKNLSPIIVNKFTESWIGSHPTINPADCIDNEIDTSFFYSVNDAVNISARQCPNHVKHVIKTPNELIKLNYDVDIRPRLDKHIMKDIMNSYGKLAIGSGYCSVADIFRRGRYYAKTYARIRQLLESEMNRSIINELTKRSLLWYGQEPHTLLHAINALNTTNI